MNGVMAHVPAVLNAVIAAPSPRLAETYSSGATASRARIQVRTGSGIGSVFCAL